MRLDQRDLCHNLRYHARTMTSRHHTTSATLLIVCLLFFFSTVIPAVAEVSPDGGNEQPPTTPETGAPLEIKTRISTFEYRIEGRPDPFLPFITERSTRHEDPNEIVEENKILTGMQLFEPSQLTLVALMATTEADKFAMVQDFTGKGYIIKVGTKIGRRGVVSEITSNRVIIEETAKTRSGQTLTNKIAMVLKKEGEE